MNSIHENRIVRTLVSLSLQSLTGNYRFFTGKFEYREILITCFGNVQGLKGQISMKYREIYAFCLGISILYLIHFITGISLFFEKQQHGNLLKQGKLCKFDRGKNVNKTRKICNQNREKVLLKQGKPCNWTKIKL